MASTRFAMRLCVCTVLLTGILGADPTTELGCQSVFKSGSDNDVTYQVNSVGITNANCFLASTVTFTYTPHGETEGRQVCSHQYPPASCNDFDTSDTCGCTKQEGDVYTYKYTFPTNTHSLCGKIQARLCIEPSGPFEEDVSPNCNTIRFADPVSAIVLLTLAQLVMVAASVVAIYFYVYRSDFTLFGSGKNKAVFVGLLFAVLTGLICVAVATTFACRNFPKESSCTPVCTACIALACIDVFVFVVIMIIIVIIKKCKGSAAAIIALCTACTAGIIARLACLACRGSEETPTPPPETPTPPPPPVTITSERFGQSKDKYELKWTVPAIGAADIEQFSIQYGQVKGKTQREPVMPLTPIGEKSKPIIVDGKCRSKTLESLSANTFYQVTITVIKKNGNSVMGLPFFFKTA